MPDQLDAELTPEEVAQLAKHYPEMVGEGAEGHLYCIYSRRELVAMSARFPTMVTHLNRSPARTGDPVQDELRARYPSMVAPAAPAPGVTPEQARYPNTKW